MINEPNNLISYSQVDRIVSWFSGLDHKKLEKLPQEHAWSFIHEVYHSNMTFDEMKSYREKLEKYLNKL